MYFIVYNVIPKIRPVVMVIRSIGRRKRVEYSEIENESRMVCRILLASFREGFGRGLLGWLVIGLVIYLSGLITLSWAHAWSLLVHFLPQL